MFRLKSQNIQDFPFEDYASLEGKELETQAITHCLTNFNSWMLPQILAHYGAWKLHWVDNKVDYKQTAKHNIGDNKWNIGLWKVCTQLKRGSLVKTQNKTPQYSALVPLILAGAKQYQNIPYSSWAIDEHCFLVDKNLLEMMLWRDDVCRSLGSEEILQIRTKSLSGRTGLDKKDPKSVWKLQNISDTVLHGNPVLVNTVLTQCWVAHPSLRHQLMVLDPYNWDQMPEPLIPKDIFMHENQLLKTFQVNTVAKKMPWEEAEKVEVAVARTPWDA